MDKNSLIIDTFLHEKLGMTIVSKEHVERSKRLSSLNVSDNWPNDYGFYPEGVSLEQAREAVKKCK